MLLTGILIGIIVLNLIVVAHELGHALVGRKYGTVVEEFGIGFPPKAWSKKVKKSFLGDNVEFSINWLPLGGFVRFQGEHDAAAKKGDYGAMTFWQKTQVLLAWKNSDQSDATKADIARGFEDAVVDTLAIKCERALDEAGCDTLVVAGGVGANRRLRAKLVEMCAIRGGRACFPRPALCTDNGAMIAFAGALRLNAGQRDDASVHVTPRWDMATLPAV